MRYYRFNRSRTLWSAYRYVEMQKKTNRMINSGRSRMVDSGFFENETWGALHKAWKGYVIAINKNERDKTYRYARIIQELQHDLGLRISSFPNVGMTPLTFYAARLSKLSESNRARNKDHETSHSNDNNTNSNNRDYNGPPDEHLTDNGKVDDREYLTDENSQDEYFDDDFNAKDRFTS